MSEAMHYSTDQEIDLDHIIQLLDDKFELYLDDRDPDYHILYVLFDFDDKGQHRGNVAITKTLISRQELAEGNCGFIQHHNSFFHMRYRPNPTALAILVQLNTTFLDAYGGNVYFDGHILNKTNIDQIADYQV